MKKILTLACSLGLSAAVLPTSVSFTNNYKAIETLIDCDQSATIRESGSGGSQTYESPELKIANLSEARITFDKFVANGGFSSLHAQGSFDFATYQSPEHLEKVELTYFGEDNDGNWIYGYSHTHEDKNGWATQKATISIAFEVYKNGDLTLQTTVRAESYGAVHKVDADSHINGISFIF
jgi:hypothetical protein